MRYILASASPRRKELLERVGMKIEILPSESEEKPQSKTPSDVVYELSKMKASEVAGKLIGDKDSYVIIGADTVVSFQGEIMGKPTDREDALRMIRLLQGNVHDVYTGVTVIIHSDGEVKEKTFYECTKVEVYPMSEDLIEAYLDTNEYSDKAGAYGIQGSFMAYVKGINGEYANVVGLPIARLLSELRDEQLFIWR